MISTMILTLNEEINLPHCLAALKECDDVVVIDSFSSDRTCELARESGARVFQHEFTGFGDQPTWALENVKFKHPWVLILDADEKVTPGLWAEMVRRVNACPPETAAFQLKRRFFWDGKWLRFANLYPTWVVRLVRVGRVRYHNRGHAETQTVDGDLESLGEDLLDENHKGMAAWRERQWRYAEQEGRYELESDVHVRFRDLWSEDPLLRQATLKYLARHLPARGFCYFIYSYLLRSGWRDGVDGFNFCLEKARFQSVISRFGRHLRKHVLPLRSGLPPAEGSIQGAKSRISVAIFTLNEEVNLSYCMESVKGCDDIVVVDSFSTDNTVQIAERLGARVVQNKFTGFGDQRMWLLEHVPLKHPWVLILDADERVTGPLWMEMGERLATCSEKVGAFCFKRRFFWNGRRLHHANLYPSWVVRLVRVGRVRFSNRGHAETQEVDGEVVLIAEDLLDDNHKSLEVWHERQRFYVEKEVEHELGGHERLVWGDLTSRDPLRRRGAWKMLGTKLPARGFCYFMYSYLFQNGWMDGWAGLRFCLAKAYYQGMISRRVHEARKGMAQ